MNASRTEYQRAYREANRERINARTRAWREANKDHVNANRKAWYEANKDHVLASRRAWCEANRGHVNARNRAWREANIEDRLIAEKGTRDKNREKYNEKQRTDPRAIQARLDYRTRNKARIAAREKRYKIANLQEQRRKDKLKRDALEDGYIRGLLAGPTSLVAAEIPQELVDAKKAQLKLHRKVKKAKG